MKLYVLSTQYISSGSYASEGKKGEEKKFIPTNFSMTDFKSVFNASKGSPLIACKQHAEAIFLSSCLAKKCDSVTSDFGPLEQKYSSVLVVFTMDIPDESLVPEEPIQAEDLVNYVPDPRKTDPSCVGFNTYSIQDELSGLSKPILIRKLSGLELKDVQSAAYLNAQSTDVVVCSLQNQSSSYFNGISNQQKTSSNTNNNKDNGCTIS
jgi:hypothetical protein